MYRGKDKTCEYRALTPDSDETGSDVHVTAKTVSDVKGIKLYRVKESVAKARLRIKAGLVILRYTEFLKTLDIGTSTLSEQTDYLKYKAQRKEVLNDEHEGIEELLLQEFGLGVEARQLFFDTKIFKRWVSSKSLSLEFSEVISTLMYVVNLRIRQSTQDQELARVTPESPLGNSLEDNANTNDETETRN
jgi:hypothetical protein